MKTQNTFRVVEILGSISRVQAESLLNNLPMRFDIRERASVEVPRKNDPIDVYVRGSIVSLYPPAGSMIITAMMEECEAARQMRFECIADMVFPGGGQIRTAIYFNPGILGIPDWASLLNGELEIDIHVYPIDRGGQQQFSVPDYHDEVVTADAEPGNLK